MAGDTPTQPSIHPALHPWTGVRTASRGALNLPLHFPFLHHPKDQTQERAPLLPKPPPNPASPSLSICSHPPPFSLVPLAPEKCNGKTNDSKWTMVGANLKRQWFSNYVPWWHDVFASCCCHNNDYSVTWSDTTELSYSSGVRGLIWVTLGKMQGIGRTDCLSKGSGGEPASLSFPGARGSLGLWCPSAFKTSIALAWPCPCCRMSFSDFWPWLSSTCKDPCDYIVSTWKIQDNFPILRSAD